MPSDRPLFIIILNCSRVHPALKIKQSRRVRRHRFSAWLVGRSTRGRARLLGGLPTSQGGRGGVKQARGFAAPPLSAWQTAGVCVDGLARPRSLQPAGKGAGVGTTSARPCRATAFCRHQPQQPIHPPGKGGKGKVGPGQRNEVELPRTGLARLGDGGWVRQARGLPRHRFLYAPTLVFMCTPTSEDWNTHNYRGLGAF